MSDATVVTTVGPPLGYVVGIVRNSRVRLPSFADVYGTREDAENEIARIKSNLQPQLAPVAARYAVLELREAGP